MREIEGRLKGGIRGRAFHHMLGRKVVLHVMSRCAHLGDIREI